MSLTPADLAAAKAFRDSQRALLAQENASQPAGITADVHIRNVRHDCAARGGKSVSLYLREHYVFSPEYWTCYCGVVDVLGEFRVFPHDDCDGGKVIAPARRFGFIFTEGRCPQCGMTARSGTGRLVDPGIRPPSERAVVSGLPGLPR